MKQEMLCIAYRIGISALLEDDSLTGILVSAMYPEKNRIQFYRMRLFFIDSPQNEKLKKVH